MCSTRNSSHWFVFSDWIYLCLFALLPAILLISLIALYLTRFFNCWSPAVRPARVGVDVTVYSTISASADNGSATYARNDNETCL